MTYNLKIINELTSFAFIKNPNSLTLGRYITTFKKYAMNIDDAYKREQHLNKLDNMLSSLTKYNLNKSKTFNERKVLPANLVTTLKQLENSQLNDKSQKLNLILISELKNLQILDNLIYIDKPLTFECNVKSPKGYKFKTNIIINKESAMVYLLGGFDNLLNNNVYSYKKIRNTTRNI